MKKSFSILFLILLAFNSCNRVNDKNLIAINSNKSIFSHALECEILKMIEIKKQITNNKKEIEPKVCNIVMYYDNKRGGICTVSIALSVNIALNSTKLTPPSDSPSTQIDSNVSTIGYTFFKNELIVCYLLSDSCRNSLIDKNGLIPVGDSIPGYPDLLKSDPDLIYETPMRTYRVVNNDSLQLIESSFIP